MGWHRVDLVVLEYNLRAIRSYEKCGFVREGILRETIKVDGTWRTDLMIFADGYQLELITTLNQEASR